ncbi:MAG: OFA family MFS transporter [Deltaproteobacteria bacterium]|jgi:MFS transporter, OFA family, oxalate/formate antiporter|nr:OFA family MFS transporter [Deltaproteobacteria bacterium]
MGEGKTFNRWLVVLGALLIQVSLGAIYIYSVFKPGLKDNFPSWSDTDLALPAQLVLAFFALGVIAFGRIQDKVGPRPIASLGGVLLGIGLVIASYAPSLMVFVLGFSIIGGIGIGAAYVCPIATCVKWFPDKRGLITGLAVAGFGAGALFFTPIAKGFIASVGMMNTFLYLGIIFLIAVLIGAQLMVNPPAGYKPAGWNPPAAAAGAKGLKADYTWQEMLKTPQFYFLWLAYFAGCTAGLMVIMNVTNVYQSCSLLDLVRSMSPVSKGAFNDCISQAATAVMIVAILNALGRIVWGKVSDNIGRKPTLLIMFVYSGVIMLLLNWFTSYPLFLFGVASVGFCFGGFLALFPAVTADYFGTKNVGANYGWMFAAYGVGGLFGPWLAPKLMVVLQKISYESVDKAGAVVLKTFSAGNFLIAFAISGIMCLVAAGLILIVKPPSGK